MDGSEILSEPYPVADQYADDLGKIEVTGQNLRFVLVTKRERDAGDVDYDVVIRVVMPISSVLPAIGRVLRHKIWQMTDISAMLAAVAKFWRGDHPVH